MALPYLLEKQVAIAAVTRACHLTSYVFATNAAKRYAEANAKTGDAGSNPTLTQTKSDLSPVTVADYSSQALINSMLKEAFPDDPIVGEEDADDLRHLNDKTQALRDKIVEFVNDALSQDGYAEGESKFNFDPKRKRGVDELLEAIDRGRYAGGPKGRMWCLDPIDGTKGFLRGGQYAVCLALIVDSEVKVGVIGCPNLPFGKYAASGKVTPGSGSIYVAVRGHGAEQRPYPSSSGTSSIKLTIPTYFPEDKPPPLRLLESVESAHSSHSFSSLVSKALQITNPPLQMDSQAKYCVLAAQSMSSETGGDIYFRFPVPGKNYSEKIWDHAAGSLLVEEAGGVVSDSRGEKLNFGLGRTLGENFGIVAAGQIIYPKVMEGIKAAKEMETQS
ncbi:hypothetical protein FRC02_004453 [Tulasnella sp. 418]|nr:hypothetical protein FRC02_004453 [Tulasnella sp. 418]